VNSEFSEELQLTIRFLSASYTHGVTYTRETSPNKPQMLLQPYRPSCWLISIWETQKPLSLLGDSSQTEKHLSQTCTSLFPELMMNKTVLPV